MVLTDLSDLTFNYDTLLVLLGKEVIELDIAGPWFLPFFRKSLISSGFISATELAF